MPTDPGRRSPGGRGFERHLVRRLGHSIRLEHGNPEALLDRRLERRGKRRGTGARKAQGVRGRRLRLGAADEHVVDRRHRRIPRRSMADGVVPERPCAEARRRDDRAAGVERRERRREQAVDVEERHDAKADVVRRERVVVGDRTRRVREVALPQRHDLRLARGPARVQEQRHRVGIGLRDRCRPPTEGELASRPFRHVDHRDAELGAHVSRGCGGLALEEHRARAQVIEIGAELRRGVGRIERCGGCSGSDDREEGEHDLGPIHERERDCVARFHARTGELLRKPSSTTIREARRS